MLPAPPVRFSTTKDWASAGAASAEAAAPWRSARCCIAFVSFPVLLAPDASGQPVPAVAQEGGPLRQPLEVSGDGRELRLAEALDGKPAVHHEAERDVGQGEGLTADVWAPVSQFGVQQPHAAGELLPSLLHEPWVV